MFRLVGIILISHGLLAEGMKDAAEMIVGPQEKFQAIGMSSETDLNGLRHTVERAVAALGGEKEVLVLVDILGGNPANASSSLAQRGVQVICGVNLPMLLELLIQRENSTLRELTAIAVQAAKEGVINLTQQLAHPD